MFVLSPADNRALCIVLGQRVSKIEKLREKFRRRRLSIAGLYQKEARLIAIRNAINDHEMPIGGRYSSLSKKGDKRRTALVRIRSNGALRSVALKRICEDLVLIHDAQLEFDPYLW